MTLQSQGEAREDEGLQPVAVTGQAGPLALVGSGEFTPSMLATDEALLDAVEAEGFERAVAVLPTAAAAEGDDVVDRWFGMAREHYDALGAEVLEVDVRRRHDATALGHVADVGEVGLVYLSGGSPEHLTATLRGTPLVDAVLEQWRLGAALVGCSAGAMALAAAWPPFLRTGGGWGTGLGIVHGVAVVPHFDLVRRTARGALEHVVKDIPDGLRLVGIDEDTALVHTNGWHTAGPGGAWEVHPDGVRPVDPSTLPVPS